MRRSVAVHTADIEMWRSMAERELRGPDGIVPEEVRLRARRFLREADALRCLTAELLRRSVLARKTGIEPSRLELGAEPGGKPFLIGVDGVHFNTAHSGRWVILAVDSGPVGVDVEEIRPIDPDVANSCFTSLERERLRGPDAGPEFFRLWALKESYLKGRGEGLRRDPLTAEIRIVEGEEALWHAGDDFRIVPLEIAEGYTAAVCAKREFDVRLVEEHPTIGAFAGDA